MKLLEKAQNIVLFFIGLFFGYIGLGLFTDVRIDRVRPFIIKQGVEEGVKAGVVEYEKRYLMNEKALVRERQARDAALKEYGRRLNKILEMK